MSTIFSKIDELLLASDGLRTRISLDSIMPFDEPDYEAGDSFMLLGYCVAEREREIFDEETMRFEQDHGLLGLENYISTHTKTPNNVEALLYSIDFFGGAEFVPLSGYNLNEEYLGPHRKEIINILLGKK